MQATEAYDLLVKELDRIHLLGTASGILSWDEQVNLPEGAAALRGRTQAALADILHRESTAPQIGRWLDLLEGAALTPEQSVVVHHARREYRRATRLPAEFVTRRALAESAGYHAWVGARERNDFAAFLPHLRAHLDLAREEAERLGAADAYDYWIDRFDPGMNAATIEPLFAELASGLSPLAQRIAARVSAHPTKPLRGFAIDRQETFLREVITAVGFDFSHGRIDRSVHPFCGGHPRDVRMTTRFDLDNPLDSLSGALHETGHALYEQGLPQDYPGTALAQAAGMAAHESQSRLWENQVGRGRAFWSHWEARYRELFGEALAGVSSDDLYRALNQVSPTPIRVDADEVHYNLHIILRFELEKALFRGEVSLEDLPAAWNERFAALFGYRPQSDREGCLQDVHWSGGAFGYFPSYTLGNLMAAQLWEAAQRTLPDLEAQLARGAYGELLAWLRREVHARGARLQTQELVRAITGSGLQVAPLLRYLESRYLPLYS